MPIQPNDALTRFHKRHCPDLPIDSSEVFYKLLGEINKLRMEQKGAENDDS